MLSVLLWPCLWSHGCSGRRRPRPPARLGVLTAFGAAPRSPPVPSGPSGALHTGGAWRAGVWLGASARCPARPRHRPPAPRQVPPAPFAPVGPGVLACGWVRRLVVRLWLSISNFACNSPTALSNPEIRSLELQRFLTLLKLHPIELHAKFVWGWVMPSPTGAAARPLCRPAISHVIPSSLFKH